MTQATPNADWKVQLFRLNYDQREIDAASDVVRSGWLTMGERVQEFERAFAKMLGHPSVRTLAVTNCTAALHMAVLAAGVGPGDEVIVPSLTFVADANIVRLVGATPVFVDCKSADDLTVSPEDIERKVTAKTKAVIIVHYAGYPCDMDPIVAVCKKHKLPLIEDVAHAPGATYKGKTLGTIGDIGCFSFFSNKNLSIGEGGMLSFSDPQVGQNLAYLRSHGMTTLTLDRHKGRAFTYDVAQPGLNYRMDEIHAALGLVQLDKLLDANAKRERLTSHYRRALSSLAVDMPFAKTDFGRSAYHILPILLPQSCDREKVMTGLKAQGVQSSIHYPPFWAFTAYSGHDPQSTPVTRSIVARQLTLPLYPDLTTAQVDYVVDALRKTLEAD